jgi:hypothetical protein
MMTDNKKKRKKDPVDLDVCTQVSVAEHARPNEPAQDACDDGRAGTDRKDKPVKPS